MTHAQYDTDSHIRAIRALRPFDTYGNLSGSPVPLNQPGYMHGAARTQYLADLDAHRIDYVLRSYWTPIAWRRTDGTWVIDHTRHGAASDKALSQAIAVVRRMSDVLESTHIGVNWRHGLSPAQYAMLQDAVLGPVKPTGQGKRTLYTLLREGYVINGPFDTYTATDLGRAVFFGYAVEVRYAPFRLTAVAA
jgi:hypothetical protein